MAVNDKIRVIDYNSIRGTVANVMGTGAGPFGYGQALNSSNVAEGNKITATEITQLRNDIINAWNHIFGTLPSAAQPQIGNTVRFSSFGTSTTEFNISEFNIAEYNLVTVNDADSPYPQYELYANAINIDRFTVAGSQSAVAVPAAPSSSTWPGIYGANWTSQIQCTITATWPDPNLARYFWNSGGQIRITASRTGGSGTSQNTSWTSILSSAGTQSYGGAIPGTGVSPNDAQNWYRCTNSRQIWYSLSGSSPYGSNTYRISARTLDAAGGNNATGTARQGEWHIEFIDNYVDPGIAPMPPGTPIQTAVPADFPPDDSVDGTFTVSVSLLYATGILVPLGLGNFSVALPTVTISAVAPPS